MALRSSVRSADPASGWRVTMSGVERAARTNFRAMGACDQRCKYQPGIFTAVMDYGQFSDDLAADTDPTTPAPVGI
jgi:hypothetical protein